MNTDRLVIVDGVRTPFCKMGSELAPLAADELGRIAVNALLTRIGLDPGLSDPVCGLNMGETAEVLAREFGITRAAQDEFSLQSHQRALAARERLAEEMCPVFPAARGGKSITADNGPRENQSLD